MRYLIKLHAVQNYRSAHIRAGDDCASAGGAHDARDAESASTATQSLSARENKNDCESAKNDCKRAGGVPWDYCVDHGEARQASGVCARESAAREISTATQSLNATENVCGSACESAKNDCKRDDGVPWDYCVDHSGASQLQAIRLVLEPAWTLLP